MLEKLDQIDRSIFLYLNSLHADFLDPIMWFITGKKEWIFFYALIVIFLFWKFKWHGITVLVGITITIILCDQFSSGFCKPFFARLRPSRTLELEGLVHILHNYRGGKYGFISSHAANSFGLATFLYFILKPIFKPVVWMFAWAALVSYSRIYVGVHYLGDIIAGALAGFMIGYLVYCIFQMVIRRLNIHPLMMP